MKPTQSKALNCSKFIAILAVVIDHSYGILYLNQFIQYTAFFSVPVFILISGFTSYQSASRHAESWWQSILRSCKKIVIAYCIATAIYLLCSTRGFDFFRYLEHLVFFSASFPFYFVLLYVQLMLVSRFLFMLLQKCPQSVKGYLAELGILLAAIIFAWWSVNYTNILNVRCGGGKLLGGTYLFLFLLGMLAAKHSWLKARSSAMNIRILAISGLALALILFYIYKYGFALDALPAFASGTNPPGAVLCAYAICMLFFSFSLFSLLENTKAFSWLSTAAAWLGQHTLYIFLYHRLVLDYFLVPKLSLLPDSNIWLARAVFLILMIAVPIAIEFVIDRLLKAVGQLMSNSNQERASQL